MSSHLTTSPRDRYNTWAESYDERTARFGWTAPEFLLEAVTPLIPPTPSVCVLDVGVGTGQASVLYLEVGASVTGLDVSEQMLSQAELKYPQFYALIEHDFNQSFIDTGLSMGSFDLILSCGAIHFAQDLGKTLAELKWLLAPGGVLAFTYIPNQKRQFSAAAQLHDPSVVEEILRQIGLVVLNSESFIAYYEGENSDDPVIYQRIVARCSQPAVTLPVEFREKR